MAVAPGRRINLWAAGTVGALRHIIRQHLRKAVLVTLKTGEGFRGVLFDADGDAFVLRNAAAVEANGTDRTPTPVDGELVILRADVAFCQFI